MALALIFFILITGLFLDFTGTLHAWFGWMAKIQLLPAVLALNVCAVAFVALLTIVLGRVYCSVICPLGVLQDIVSWLSGRRKGKRLRFRHSPGRRWLRYGVLAVFIALMLAGAGSVAALIAPYSAYGRIASSLFAPIYLCANNVLAGAAEHAGSYAFYERDVWLRSVPVVIVAAVTLVVIVILSWRRGRIYCNSVCPVGTVLGFLSRYSLLRPVIDTGKCVNCQLCERRCKASCIDARSHKIDYSRCVACLDCVEECRHGAIAYTLRKGKAPAKVSPAATGAEGEELRSSGKAASSECVKPANEGRRNFLIGAGMLLGSAAVGAEEKKVDGGLAVILDKKPPRRTTRIAPPGALSLENMSKHCTGCQLCVSVCPNDVLRPSGSLSLFMQPEVSYERGYCRPECVKCSEVCPAGAIIKISKEEKSSIQTGHAVWIRDNCLPATDGVECGNCARHCPAGAIIMVENGGDGSQKPRVPAVNEERCIGCGACENLCPARPFSAIYVEGHEVHKII